MSDYVLVGFLLWLVLIILACACVLALYMGMKQKHNQERLFGTIMLLPISRVMFTRRGCRDDSA